MLDFDVIIAALGFQLVSDISSGDYLPCRLEAFAFTQDVPMTPNCILRYQIVNLRLTHQIR